jgi:hypothetical protein
MISQSAVEGGIQRNRVPWILAACGLIVIAASIPTAWVLARGSVPGKIIPKEDLLTWRSPSGEKGASLSMEDTKTIFEIRNDGGRPVRILEWSTSCGCATPRIEPTTILPQGVGIVEVQTVPFPTGEKTATITLRTDSPITPEVKLQLRVIGTRRPPYLLKALGDMSFQLDSASGVTREILAYSIEVSGSKPNPPIVTTDISFVHVGKSTLVDDKPYVEQGTVARIYRFEVSCSRGMEGAFAGDIVVTDPWDKQHVERLRAHGEIPPMMNAVPSRVILKAGQSGSLMKIMVKLREPAPKLIAKVVEGDSAPFTVGPIQSVEGNRHFLIPIQMNEGDTRAGEWTIRVTQPSSSQDLDIPIAIRGEGH